MGFERFREPKLVPLAVKGAYAKLVGQVTSYLEVEGYVLPEMETIGVIEDLAADAIVGLNIMESDRVYIEGDEIKSTKLPTSMII